MPENDIYNSKAKYDSIKEAYKLFAKPIDAHEKRKYYCRNPSNLIYFERLMSKFEAKDTSYVRRLRLINTLKLITFATDKDLKDCDRSDIDGMMKFMHSRYNSPKSKADFVLDSKHIWKQLFPEIDEKGRIDDSIVPYAVRHLSAKQDKSTEKARKDRMTYQEYERIVSYFKNNAKMQAYLTLALESLGRPQELLYLRIKDIELHDNYAKIHISEHGKEGIGILQCINSYPYLLSWLQKHPLSKDSNAFLFVSDRGYNQLSPFGINKHLRIACGRLNINKPVTCYSLKRNGVTFRRLAGETDMEIQHAARWTSTKQLQTYDMSNQEDALKMALIRKGMIKDDKGIMKKEVMQLKECLFCGNKAGFHEEICPSCKHILDRSKVKQQIDASDEAEKCINRLESQITMIYEMLKAGKHKELSEGITS